MTNVVFNRTFVGKELDVSTIDLDVSALALLDVLLATEVGETPVLGHDDFLSARELVLGAAQSLDGVGQVGVTGSDAEQDLTNLDTGNETIGLSVSTSHTGLETIGSGARQLHDISIFFQTKSGEFAYHLVDTDNVVRVCAHTHVETVLTTCLDHVLVRADTGSLKRLGAQLLEFVGDEMYASRELIGRRALPA